MKSSFGYYIISFEVFFCFSLFFSVAKDREKLFKRELLKAFTAGSWEVVLWEGVLSYNSSVYVWLQHRQRIIE
jgi:hypothetical protein